MTDTSHTIPDEPDHAESSTAYLMQEMQLYGWRPYDNEPDDRPLPDERQAAGAVADMFDAMVATFIDTRLEPDLDDLLWGIVNVFHRAIARVERDLDDNEVKQKRLQREQDGSEVASQDLERTTREGLTLIERRDAMEFFRDACADQFRLHIRKPWTPRSGSKVNRKKLTYAVIDSRDFINARRWADKQVLIPPGTRIAVSAGPHFNDVAFIYATLDTLLRKIPDMVLLHGATDTGGELISIRWADKNGVPTVPFKPDWKLGRSAPFKRNDKMLDAIPKGVVVFPGSGIQDNMRDKAKTMGIKVWDFRKRGSA